MPSLLERSAPRRSDCPGGVGLRVERSNDGPRRETPFAVAVVVGSLFAFFLLDLSFPAGVASGVPYILPVLLALMLADRRAPLFVAGIATLLTAAGFFLPYPDPMSDVFWVGVENRIIALAAIWATAMLGHLFVVRDAAVRESEARLRTVVETTPDLIVTLDADGRVESANAAALRAFDRSTTTLKGDRLAPLIGPPPKSDDGSVVSDAAELIAEGRPGVGLAAIRRGTEQRIVRWVVRPLDEAGGRLAVGHDLTELLDAQDRAVRSERLAAIGQTLATLSHESKNELLAIRFGLEQLNRCWDDRDSAAEMIDALLDSQERIWRLFEDVRGFAAPIRLRPADVTLPDVWRRAWETLAARSGRHAALSERLFVESTECVADPFRLEQVFRNLFENALAACPDPLRIEVTLTEGRWRGEPALFVTVSDDGPGLADESRVRLFEPFFTTKPQGTGIGLSLCRRILEAHHGDLVAGAPPVGAAFVLTLPRRSTAVTVEV